VHLFPNEPNAKRLKTKETTVVQHLQQTFLEFTWVADRRVFDGCSRRRPDLLVDLGNQVLVVEVDENQHTEYDCSCENKRLIELSRDVGHRPLVFVRFNPDEWVAADGTKHPSCFSRGNDGFVRVAPRQVRTWDARLNALTDQVRYWTEHQTNKLVEVVSLFFDEPNPV
jgi:Holliday junction resolvase